MKPLDCLLQRRSIAVAFVFAFFLLFTIPANAASITLGWSANTEPALAGYHLYYRIGQSGPPYDGKGLDQGDSGFTISLGDLADQDLPQFDITGIQEGRDYYFVVTAFDDNGNESEYSNEVHFRYDQPAPSPTIYAIAASAGAYGQINPQGSVAVSAASSQTFVFSAESGYHISDVLVDGRSVGPVASYTFQAVDQAHTIQALFSIDTHQINAIAGSGGSVAPNGLMSVNNGASQTFSISADIGYRIADVQVDGVSKGVVGELTFSQVFEDHEIVVSFEPVGDVLSFVLDNGSPGSYSNGSWKISGATDPYGDHSVYSREIGADYIYEKPLSGRYAVSMWWSSYDTRCASVPVEIYDHDVLLDTVVVDQTQDGGQFNQLGSYDFSQQARVVIISESSDCSTAADAVRFEVDKQTRIVDDGGIGTSSIGSWKVSGADDPFGDQSVYSREADAEYTFEATLSGRQEVSVWWSSYESRCSGVPAKIYDGDLLLDTIILDQTRNGGQWNGLGSYEFSTTARVVIVSDSTACSTSADAVRFELDDRTRIIDDGDAGTSAHGSWKVSGASDPYGDQSVYSRQIGADYLYQSQVAGSHEVAVWWSSYPSRCDRVPVEIYDGERLLDTIYLDQSRDGGHWVVLGTYDFNQVAQLRIVSSSSECSTAADAVRFIAESTDVIDDGDDGTWSTGTWKVSGGSTPFGVQSLYSNQIGARYVYDSQMSGKSQVSMWWSGYATRCDAVPVEIYDGDRMIDTVVVDQTRNSGQWNMLGTYEFYETGSVHVTSESSDCSTAADAVKFTR